MSWNVRWGDREWQGKCHAPRERVSWNNYMSKRNFELFSHAPRERVSWNIVKKFKRLQRCKSRSTWACELKFMDKDFLRYAIGSRSTWACELKSSIYRQFNYTWLVTLHVSVWVEIKHSNLLFRIYDVTLHVSVWVEILIPLVRIQLVQVTLHVSVWVEIFWTCYWWKPNRCHAPRERVSWNSLRISCTIVT